MTFFGQRVGDRLLVTGLLQTIHDTCTDQALEPICQCRRVAGGQGTLNFTEAQFCYPESVYDMQRPKITDELHSLIECFGAAGWAGRSDGVVHNTTCFHFYSTLR